MARGDKARAAESAVAAIPFGGDAFKAGKMGMRAVDKVRDAKSAGKLDDALEAAPEPNRSYSARELKRLADEPGPNHNFPESLNNQIFKGSRTVISDNYVQYSQRGTLNGRSGTYEIGVKPSDSGRTEVITHRFFRPDPK